jgi:hypothetical protein
MLKQERMFIKVQIYRMKMMMDMMILQLQQQKKIHPNQSQLKGRKLEDAFIVVHKVTGNIS